LNLFKNFISTSKALLLTKS